MSELNINYGVNRRRPGSKRKNDIEHKSGKLTIQGSWGDDETHKAIREKIRELEPGWLLTGYCPTNIKPSQNPTQ